MAKATFLITYYAQPEFLRICLDSIKKYHPNLPIIVSQQEGDDSQLPNIEVKHLRHDMRQYSWAGVAQRLIEACETDIGIFIEHDAFLLKPLDDLISKIGDYDLIGVEEMIPGLRNSPGMACQNFFILNVKKLKELGIEKVRVRNIEEVKKTCGNVESGYGLSQTFNKKYFLPFGWSHYGFGTYYGDYVHHFWWGSYPKRDVAIDNLDRDFLDEQAKRLVKDYDNNEIGSTNNLL